MIDVYRLIRVERAGDVLSGECARIYGGRWNLPGTDVVYASESRALAVLETFVHLTFEARAMRFVLCTITLPRRPRLRRYDGAQAPRSRAARREAGSAWAAEGRDVALVVPSVIVRQERNYVLNVRHPQFAQLRLGKTEKFSFDDRLWRRS